MRFWAVLDARKSCGTWVEGLGFQVWDDEGVMILIPSLLSYFFTAYRLVPKNYSPAAQPCKSRSLNQQPLAPREL